MKWDEYKVVFEWDGDWRDIYVLDADVADWQRFIDFVKSGRYPIAFTIDGEKSDLPENVMELFRGEVSPSLSA